MKNFAISVSCWLVLGCHQSTLPTQGPSSTLMPKDKTDLGPLQPVNIKERGGGEEVLCYKNQETRDRIYDILQKGHAADLHLDELSGPPQMRDSFEAFLRWGPFSLDQNGVPNTTIDQLLGHLTELKMPYFKNFFSRQDPKWEGVHSRIPRVLDSPKIWYPPVPKNCLIAQLAYYDDLNNVVHYDEDITGLMSPSELIAFKLHEIIYAFARTRIYVYNHRLLDFMETVPQMANLTENQKENLIASLKCHLIWTLDFADIIRYLVGFLLAEPNIPNHIDWPGPVEIVSKRMGSMDLVDEAALIIESDLKEIKNNSKSRLCDPIEHPSQETPLGVQDESR